MIIMTIITIIILPVG